MESQRETAQAHSDNNKRPAEVQPLAPEPLTKQLKRRGLLAAVVALGAGAAAKLAGAGRAEANNGDLLQIGNTATVGAQAATATTTIHVHGSGAGFFVDGLTGNLMGAPNPVIEALGPSLDGGPGVRGTGSIGVEGRSPNGASASSVVAGVRGVYAGTGLSIGGEAGVRGVSNTFGNLDADGNGSGIGVLGKSGSGTGVFGQTNTGWGVVGQSVGHFGVYGTSNTAAGVNGASSSGWGVAGSSSSNVGVYGSSSSAAGVYGTSTSGVGVYGNSVGNATGVFGAGTNYVGGYFQSTNNIGLQAVSMTPNVPALYAINTVAPGANRRAAQFDGNVLVNGDFAVTGAKAAVVPHPDGTLRTVYCLESPESYFEDFGEAALEKGVAAVALDPEFAALVQTGKFQVFLTPNGDCRGLYVSALRPQGFEVRELQGGTSSLMFSYRVVAKRRDVVAPRLEKLPRERIRALGLKEHTPPTPLTLPPNPVLGGQQPSTRDTPAGPQVPPRQPQVPPAQPQLPGRR